MYFRVYFSLIFRKHFLFLSKQLLLIMYMPIVQSLGPDSQPVKKIFFNLTKKFNFKGSMSKM